VLSRAVPGDLLAISGTHVVIIQDLNNPSGSNLITAYNQVQVIHSTKGNNRVVTWDVRHDVWAEVGNKDLLNYKLVRYR
jgi:hypothetical protein